MQSELAPKLTRRAYLLVVFLIVCFGFSWGSWFLVMASSAGLVPFRFPLNPFGSFGPTLGALVATWLFGGPNAVGDLLRPLLRWRVNWKWYLFALLSTAGFALVGVLVYIVAGNPAPPLQNVSQWYMVFPIALLILVLGGPLGEEIGWRGFLLPELQKKWNSLAASMIVGLFWFLWHLPLFYLEGSSQKDVPIPPYVLFVVVESVLFTWLFNKTEGSLLIVLLYHTGINVTYYCLSLVLPALDGSDLFNYSMMGASVIFALAVLALTGKNLGKKPGSLV